MEEFTEFTKNPKKEAFIKSLEDGASISESCIAANISRMAVWKWRDKYKLFDEEVLNILDSRTQTVEDALYINAIKGNIIAQIFWLKNRSKGRWKDKTEEDINLKIKSGLDFEEYKKIKEMTDDERNLLIDKLSRVCGDKDDKLIGENQTKDKE